MKPGEGRIPWGRPDGFVRECPGCGLRIVHGTFACRRCWFLLPSGLRTAIKRCWIAKDWVNYREAYARAVAFYDKTRGGVRLPRKDV